MLNKFEKIQLYLCLFILAFFVSLYFPQNPFVSKYMFLDTSVYQYIGKLITEGYIPYRDVFDHKGPLVYLYYALGYYVHPMWGVWSFEVILLFFSLVIAYQIIKKYLSPCLYVMAVATILASIPLFDSIGNNESLSFLPVMGAILILKNFIEQQKLMRLEAVILGILSAILLMIKPPLVVSNGVFVLYIIGVLLKNRSYRELLYFLFYGGIGFVLPLAVILGWLSYHHALKDFYDDYIIFNFDYMHTYKKLNTYKVSLLFFSKECLSIFTALTGVILFIKFNLFNDKERAFLGVLVIALLLGLILVITPCNDHAHYLTAVFPLVLILFGYAVYTLKSPKILLLVMYVFILLRAFNIYEAAYRQVHKDGEAAMEKISSFIKNNYPENVTVFSAAPEHCIMYLYSERYCPHKYPLGYFAAEVYRDKVTNETLQHPADIVIDNFEGKYNYFYNVNDYHPVFQVGWYAVLEHN